MLEKQRIDHKSLPQKEEVKFKLGFVVEDSSNTINTYSNDQSNRYHILVKTDDGSEIEARPANNSFLQVPLVGEHVLLYKGYKSTSNFTRRRYQWYYLPLYPIQGEVNENSIPELFGIKEFNDQTKPPADQIPLGQTFLSQTISPLQPYEGDTILQGRFGNTIRLGSSQDINSQYSVSQEWTSETGDPIIILSNHLSQNNQYHTEKISEDYSSIWLTSKQRVNSLSLSKPLSAERRNVREYNQSQLIGSADRIVLQSKRDSIILDSNQDTIILTNRLFIGTDNAPIPLTNTINLIKILQKTLTVLLMGSTDLSTGAPVDLNMKSKISEILSELNSLKLNNYRVSG